MYIPDFWIGYILGALSTLVALVIISVVYSKRKKIRGDNNGKIRIALSGQQIGNRGKNY